MSRKKRTPKDPAAEAEALREALRKLDERRTAALRVTATLVAPDLPPPREFGAEITKGWDFNLYRREVFPAWSDTTAHGEGHKRAEWGSGSQGARSLYSTRLRALQALRVAVEREVADWLIAIDEQIAKEAP